MSLLDTIVFFNTLEILFVAVLCLLILIYTYQIVCLFLIHKRHKKHDTHLFALPESSCSTSTVCSLMLAQYVDNKRLKSIATSKERRYEYRGGIPGSQLLGHDAVWLRGRGNSSGLFSITGRRGENSTASHTNLVSNSRTSSRGSLKKGDDAASNSASASPEEGEGEQEGEEVHKAIELWGLLLPCTLLGRAEADNGGGPSAESRANEDRAAPLLEFNKQMSEDRSVLFTENSPTNRLEQSYHTDLDMESEEQANLQNPLARPVHLSTRLVRYRSSFWTPSQSEPISALRQLENFIATPPNNTVDLPGPECDHPLPELASLPAGFSDTFSAPVCVTFAFGSDTATLLQRISVDASKTFGGMTHNFVCFFTSEEYAAAIERTHCLVQGTMWGQNEFGTDSAYTAERLSQRPYSVFHDAASDFLDLHGPTVTGPPTACLATHCFASCVAGATLPNTHEASFSSFGTLSFSRHSPRHSHNDSPGRFFSVLSNNSECEVEQRSKSNSSSVGGSPDSEEENKTSSAAIAPLDAEEKHRGVMWDHHSFDGFSPAEKKSSTSALLEPKEMSDTSMNRAPFSFQEKIDQTLWKTHCDEAAATLTIWRRLPIFSWEPECCSVALGDSRSESSLTSYHTPTERVSSPLTFAALQTKFLMEHFSSASSVPTLWSDEEVNLSTLFVESFTRHVNEVVLRSLMEADGQRCQSHPGWRSESDVDEPVAKRESPPLNYGSSSVRCRSKVLSGTPLGFPRMHRDSRPAGRMKLRIQRLREKSRNESSPEITGTTLTNSLPVAVMLLYRLPYIPSVFLPTDSTIASYDCLGYRWCASIAARLRFWKPRVPCSPPADPPLVPCGSRTLAAPHGIISLLYGATTEELLRADELRDARNYHRTDRRLNSVGLDTSGTVSPALIPLIEPSLSTSHSLPSVTSKKTLETDGHRDRLPTRNAVHQIGAAAGLTIPVTLHYLRIGNHLYQLEKIRDESMVQYIEKRRHRHPSVHNTVQTTSVVSSDSPAKKTTKRKPKRTAASTKTFSSFIRSFEFRNDGTQRQAHFCKQCVVEEARVIFLPCGHFALCENCASGVTMCSFCRATIHSTVLLNITATAAFNEPKDLAEPSL